ncbi:MAG: response regulator [Balneolaceae bacterium]|nr:MAG: response regulator [Balneolaceae bacterium]
METQELKGTIVIVEDNHLLSLVLGKIVEKLGYRVLAKASNGQDAIRKIKHHNPDIVLMDVSLDDGFDGIETGYLIRTFTDVPIIYISGYSDSRNIARAGKTNYVDYLIKPVTQDDLVIPLSNAIQRGREYCINQAS